MKKLFILAAAAVSFLFASCTEDGFTKVFQCEDSNPYFSKITHKCYKTQNAMEEGEAAFQKAADNNGGSKESKLDDEETED